MLVSSAMKLITPGVFDLVKAVHDGTFKGGNQTGQVGLAPFHDNDVEGAGRRQGRGSSRSTRDLKSGTHPSRTSRCL